jgi:rod shape-determining protein MreD
MSPRRRTWPFWLVLGVLVLVQFYVRPRIYAGPGAPDFLLLGLLLYALRSRPGAAAVAGFLVGAVTDILSPSQVGAGMLAHTLVAWGAAWGRAVFFADNVLVSAGVFLAGTWVRNLILLVVGGDPVDGFLAALAGWSTLQALLTAVAGTLVVLAIRHRVDFRMEE